MRPGTRVGHYELIDELGRGGMGVVYRARDLRLDRQVALKRPAPGRAADGQLHRRFLREARAASQLSSPSIVPIYEVFENNGLPWLAMELVPGSSLRALLSDQRPLPVSEVLSHGEALADAVATAHASHILHRDINPNNILIGTDGRPRLMDFGLARFFVPADEESSAATLSKLTVGGVVGTPGYMSPEQALGRPIDCRSDLFALGIVLYEMCTGRPAFTTSKEGDVRDAILHREPVAVSRLNYDVPADLERIIRKALAKNPDERYQTARDLLADIRSTRRQIEHDTYSKEHPESSPVSEPPRPRIRPLTTLLTVAVAALGTVIAVLVVRDGEQPGTGFITSPYAVPVATWQTDESRGRISPDGQWLSFISDRDGRESIWLRKVGGGDLRRLASINENVISHVWSPDGNQIAYLSRGVDGRALHITDVPFGGPSHLNLAISEMTVWLVRWIGDHIYMEVNMEVNQALHRLDLNSAEIEVAYEPDPEFQFAGGFDLLPDRSRLVFSAVRDGKRNIWVDDLQGGRLTALTDDSFNAHSPTWFGNTDDALVYVADHRGQAGLWLLNAGTGVSAPIPFGQNLHSLDDLSPDGSVAITTVRESSADLWAWDPASDRHHRLTGNTLPEIRLTTTAGNGPVFFQRNKPGMDTNSNYVAAQILTAELNRSSLEDEQVVVSDGYDPHPSADGRWLAYLKSGARKPYFTELWIQELASRRSRQITDRFQMIGMDVWPRELLSHGVVWGPGESVVYYTELSADNTTAILRLPISTVDSQPEVLVRADEPGQQIMHLWIDGEGQRLAYVLKGHQGRREVHELDLASGEDLLLHAETLPPRSRFQLVGWRAGSLFGLRLTFNPDNTQDVDILEMDSSRRMRKVASLERTFGSTARLGARRDVLYVTRADGQVHNIHRVSLEDGASEPVTRNDRPSTTFSGLLGLDDGRLVYAQQESICDIWILRSEY